MRLILMGTPDFAVPTLKALCDHNMKPLLVVTMPDKPQGRRKVLTAPPLKIAAQALGIDVLQAVDINQKYAVLAAYQPDVIVTVAYGGYIKYALRKLPRFGCLNIHPSLLPLYRGSSPVHAALYKGDTYTGVSIFKLVAGMDAGPLLNMEKIAIQEKDNFNSLTTDLSICGANLLIKTLHQLINNTSVYIKQNCDKAVFAGKLDKAASFINWQSTAVQIYNHVRSFADVPGAVASFRSQRLKILTCAVTPSASTQIPGTIVSLSKDTMQVATCDFDITISKVQAAGKKIMSLADYARGARIQVNEKLTPGF